MKTAEFSAAKKLSPVRHDRAEIFPHQVGMLAHRLAERAEDDAEFARAWLLKVVATETLSNTASTATPASAARSPQRDAELLVGAQQLGIDLVQRLRARLAASAPE